VEKGQAFVALFLLTRRLKRVFPEKHAPVWGISYYRLFANPGKSSGCIFLYNKALYIYIMKGELSCAFIIFIIISVLEVCKLKISAVCSL